MEQFFNIYDLLLIESLSIILNTGILSHYGKNELAHILSLLLLSEPCIILCIERTQLSIGCLEHIHAHSSLYRAEDHTVINGYGSSEHCRIQSV